MKKNKQGYFVREKTAIVSNDKLQAFLQEKLQEIMIDKKIYAISDETFEEWSDTIEKEFNSEG